MGDEFVMSIELFIYLASLFDELKPALQELIGFAIFIIGCGFAVLYAFDYTDEEILERRVRFKKYLLILLVSFLSIFFIPSSKTMYLIAAARYGQESLQSDTAKKVKTILDDKLDEMLKNLEEK